MLHPEKHHTEPRKCQYPIRLFLSRPKLIDNSPCWLGIWQLQWIQLAHGTSRNSGPGRHTDGNVKNSRVKWMLIPLHMVRTGVTGVDPSTNHEFFLKLCKGTMIFRVFVVVPYYVWISHLCSTSDLPRSTWQPPSSAPRGISKSARGPSPRMVPAPRSTGQGIRQVGTAGEIRKLGITNQ